MKIDDIVPNPPQRCQHSPKKQTKINSFLYFLFWKVGFRKNDNASFRCSHCDALINIPRGYYHTSISVLYCLLSALLTWLSFKFAVSLTLDVPLGIVYCVLLFVFVHSITMCVIDGIVFSLICILDKWELADPKNTLSGDSDYIENERFARDRRKKTKMEGLGVSISFVLIAKWPLLVLVPLEAIISIISCCIQKKYTRVYICFAVFLISSIILVVLLIDGRMSLLRAFSGIASFLVLILLNNYSS